LEEGERLGALDDPGPLPEGMHQNPTLLYAANALISRLRELPGVFVDFNTFVYYDRTNRNRRVSPDLYVALGVDTVAIRERHGYLIWEVGKAPDFVLEIASESTARYDCIGKRDLYASLGVGEYWRYDSTGGDFYGTPLVGEQLVGGEYRPFEVHTTADREIWAHSPVLDIDIYYWGDDRLRVYDPDSGSFKLDAEELEQQYKESEEARAATEASHIATEAAYEAERAARMRAEGEIARLQEQLRRQQS
jgi:Uma2 family endonuclease